MRTDTVVLLKQFEPIERKFEELKSSAKHGDWGYYVGYADAEQFGTMIASCVLRLSGKESVYSGRVERLLSSYGHITGMDKIEGLLGIAQALKGDVEAGYLSTLREIVHAEVFGDLLETADYFLEEGHKDPAAVIIGGVLESHLRQLCQKQSPPIDTEELTTTGSTRARKAETLNQELAKAGVYTKLEQKSVTAWLDLRNLAAHGHYSSYLSDQVQLFLAGVRDFVNRFPA